MARWLLDCEPLCGRPWRLGLADTPAERDAALRLRFDVFFREQGFGPADADRDIDEYDDWCDHVVLVDVATGQTVAACRAIRGADAVRRGGFYASHEFDFAPLGPIAPLVLQGSRTCVAAEWRTGPAVQYLSYAMELLLRETGCQYYLGTDSFRATADELNVFHSYVRRYAHDPDWAVEPRPGCRVPGLREVPVTPADERALPPVVRLDLRLGFRAVGPPAWDPEFGSYDLPLLVRRDRMTPMYESFVRRIERPPAGGVA